MPGPFDRSYNLIVHYNWPTNFFFDIQEEAIPGRIPESIFPNALFPEYYNTEKVIPESQFPNAFIPN